MERNIKLSNCFQQDNLDYLTNEIGPEGLNIFDYSLCWKPNSFIRFIEILLNNFNEICDAGIFNYTEENQKYIWEALQDMEKYRVTKKSLITKENSDNFYSLMVDPTNENYFSWEKVNDYIKKLPHILNTVTKHLDSAIREAEDIESPNWVDHDPLSKVERKFVEDYFTKYNKANVQDIWNTIEDFVNNDEINSVSELNEYLDNEIGGIERISYKEKIQIIGGFVSLLRSKGINPDGSLDTDNYIE